MMSARPARSAMPAKGPKGRPEVRETAQRAMVPREAAAPAALAWEIDRALASAPT